LDIPSSILTDGPNGIRLSLNMTGVGGMAEILDSEPAKCFLSAVAEASSRDVDLEHDVGAC